MKFPLKLFVVLYLLSNIALASGELTVKYALLSRYPEFPVELGLSIIEPISEKYTFRSYAGIRPDNFWLVNGYVTRNLGLIDLGLGGAVTTVPSVPSQLRFEVIGIIKLW